MLLPFGCGQNYLCREITPFVCPFIPSRDYRLSHKLLECVCKIISLCHSEERSDEESHFQTQFRVANRDSSLLPVAQNDMALFCIQTLIKAMGLKKIVI